MVVAQQCSRQFGDGGYWKTFTPCLWKRLSVLCCRGTVSFTLTVGKMLDERKRQRQHPQHHHHHGVLVQDLGAVRLRRLYPSKPECVDTYALFGWMGCQIRYPGQCGIAWTLPDRKAWSRHSWSSKRRGWIGQKYLAPGRWTPELAAIFALSRWWLCCFTSMEPMRPVRWREWLMGAGSSTDTFRFLNEMWDMPDAFHRPKVIWKCWYPDSQHHYSGLIQSMAWIFHHSGYAAIEGPNCFCPLFGGSPLVSGELVGDAQNPSGHDPIFTTWNRSLVMVPLYRMCSRSHQPGNCNHKWCVKDSLFCGKLVQCLSWKMDNGDKPTTVQTLQPTYGCL